MDDLSKGGRRNGRISLKAWYEKWKSRGMNESGQLMPNPVPVAPPVGYERKPSLAEQIRDAVRSEQLAAAARAAGAETFEESEDFDVEDDQQLHSPWENEFDPELSEIIEAGREALAAKKAQAHPAEPGSGQQAPKSDPPTDGPGGATTPVSGSQSAPKGAGA